MHLGGRRLPARPVDALVSLLHPLQAMVDHSSYSQGPRIPAQEGDVMASGQTLQTAHHMFLCFLKKGGVLEHVVKVQVEQGDACGHTDTVLVLTLLFLAMKASKCLSPVI